MDILDKIVLHKRKEILKRKQLTSIKELESSGFYRKESRSLKDSIAAAANFGIISEFKRKSPSKGIINSDSDILNVCRAYEEYGASAVSVLTDSVFFGGSLEDLILVANEICKPVLQKDFIIDEYQIIEARACGADAILLIASVLTKKELKKFAATAGMLGLDYLMEVHTIQDIDKVSGLPGLVGVNNRNLGTFSTDINNSIKLASHLGEWPVRVSESGIHKYDELVLLGESGYKGFLIGESFMKEKDPGIAFKEFFSKTEN